MFPPHFTFCISPNIISYTRAHSFASRRSFLFPVPLVVQPAIIPVHSSRVSTIMPQLYARDRTFGTDTPRKQNELALFGSSNVNISIFHRLSGSWLGPKNDWDRRQLSSSIPIDERACSIPHPVTYYLLLNACLSASRAHACYEALLNFTLSLVSIPGPHGPRHFAQPFD